MREEAIIIHQSMPLSWRSAEQAEDTTVRTGDIQT